MSQPASSFDWIPTLSTLLFARGILHPRGGVRTHPKPLSLSTRFFQHHTQTPDVGFSRRTAPLDARRILWETSRTRRTRDVDNIHVTPQRTASPEIARFSFSRLSVPESQPSPAEERACMRRDMNTRTPNGFHCADARACAATHLTSGRKSSVPSERRRAAERLKRRSRGSVSNLRKHFRFEKHFRCQD